jgi:GDP-4-dehydro-6-deoxy-D-mannose reductase
VDRVNTVAITGIGGFIGRTLASRLRDLFPAVSIVALGRGRHLAADRSYEIDLLDPASLRCVMKLERPDVIFHLAGVVSSSNWQELHCGNVQTTINLLDAVEATHPPCRVVIPGSAAEYGSVAASDLPLDELRAPNPLTHYGVSKAWQTTVSRYYASCGLHVVIARIFNVIGPGIPETLSIGAFVSQLKRIRRGDIEREIRVGNLAPRRDFVDVRDVGDALMALAKDGVPGEIYNVCSGRSVSMAQILSALSTGLGVDVGVTVDPARVKAAEIADIYGSNAKIHRATGWQPMISFSESVRSAVSQADD